MRTAHSGDTVFIKRKKARAYAYGALDHRDQEEEALRHLSRTFERGRASAARGRSGRGRRVVVRTQSGGTAVRSSGLSQTVGGGKNIRERSSGQGNIGASSSPQGRPGAAQGGQTTGRSGTSGGAGGQMPANR